MSESDWKEKIIQERLGGKKDWTDSERLELSHQLDRELEEKFDQLLGKPSSDSSKVGETSRPKDAWTEENWKEKMAEHPIFTPYTGETKDGVVQAPDNALTDGLAQLKFSPDHNSPDELARNYKEDGIHHFKYKKYRLAVASFSEGLRVKCTDSELLTQLLNNRAAAYFRLGNYRSAIRDCEQAVALKPDYRKAIHRAAESADRLGQWEELLKWADRGLLLNPTDEVFVELRRAALEEKNKSDRITRKRHIEEHQKLLAMKQLLSEIEKRGVKLEERQEAGSTRKDDDCEDEELRRVEIEIASLPNLEPCHPSAVGSKVHQNKAGDLVWPVLLVYPEYHQTDFIQHFNEKHSLRWYLEKVALQLRGTSSVSTACRDWPSSSSTATAHPWCPCTSAISRTWRNAILYHYGDGKQISEEFSSKV
ncbi:hypothetical protein HAZT_HAZT010882 [Hyalella azteca]|uniref:Cns1/TTC4 wheel domain-containing protein n=1 Tax=Hyalella azteca TaxID=294128 RepID=A0A6A0GRI9_HYAAZ|nr:hypothetical protein HAZT_HAZT010882 [Hyalella azteca]